MYKNDARFESIVSMMEYMDGSNNYERNVVDIYMYEDHVEAETACENEYGGVYCNNDRQELPLSAVEGRLFFFLTEENVMGLIGRKVKFRAPAYEGNHPYFGVALIKKVDFSKHNPIECDCLSGDDLKYAFLDHHGLETHDGGETYQMTDHDFCFSYSDSYREVEVIVYE